MVNLKKLMKNSSFFINIYKNEKENSKKDIDCINQTEMKFNKLKNIFTNKPLNSLRKDILYICINSIKRKNEKEISNEVDLLIKILKRDLNNSEYNKNIIVHNLFILSKRENIYYTSIAISEFIDNIGAKKTEFYSILKDIISNLKDCYLEEIISKAINRLKKYDIDIDILYNENYKNNNYINILMKLKEHPDSIKFLLERNIYECRELMELVEVNSNSLLSTNDVLDLEKCVKLMSKIGTIQTIKEMKDSDIIYSFIKKLENYKNIEKYFTQYVNNYQELENLLFFYSFDISKGSKQKIALICHKSTFILKSVKNEFFIGNYCDDFFEDKESKYKKKYIENKIDMNSLLELRDKAKLSKKIICDEVEIKF